MRCSGCQGLGHNRRSQQCPVVLQSLIASTDCQLQQSEDFQQQIGGIPVNPPSTCATVLSSQVSVSAFQDSPLFGRLQPVSATENTRNSNIPDLSEPLTPARHSNFPIRHLPTPFTHPTPDQWKLDYLARSKSVREWSPVIAQETTCSEDIATTNQSQPRTPVRQTITALLQLSALQLSCISPFKSFRAENRTNNHQNQPQSPITNMQPTFQRPITLEEIDTSPAPDNEQDWESFQQQVHELVPDESPQAPSLEATKAVPAIPLKPLHPDRPEMCMIHYNTERSKWLEENPTVSIDKYREVRGLPTYTNNDIKYHCYRHLHFYEWQAPTGEIVSREPNWTNEEVIAWIDNQRRLDDELMDKMTREQAGKPSLIRGLSARDLYKHLSTETHKEGLKYTM